MPIQTRRRIYRSAELPALLQLSDEAIAWFVKCGQLTPTIINGEVFFDSRVLKALKATRVWRLLRKRNHVQQRSAGSVPNHQDAKN